MNDAELAGNYQSRADHFQKEIKKATGRLNALSLARLLVLLALVWALVRLIGHNSIPAWIMMAALLVLFLVLISYFNRIKSHRELLRKLKELNESEIRYLAYEFQDQYEGREFLDTSHPWSNDLDLFGSGSLFQYLNRSSTPGGRQMLAAFLQKEAGSAREVRDRQEQVKDLSARIEFRQQFTARARLLKEDPGDQDDLASWLESKAYITRHPWLFFLALGISGFSVFILITAVLDPSRFWYLLYLLLFNFSILSPFLLRTQVYQSRISRKHQFLQGYSQLLGLLAEESFSHPRLLSYSHKARAGMRELARLSKLMNMFDQRLNMLLGAILNGLFLFDFILLHLLEGWKKRNQEDILDWMRICAHSDALISLAGFAYNHSPYAWPLVDLDPEDGTKQKMELKDLGHPLIPSGRRVLNDLSLEEEQVVVITGANMAGKSTFLRSLGINMVLCYAGCPVCASTFRTRYMGLHSSMRTADSLRDDESYFLAEIRKLQSIVQRMQRSQPLLILLDEVLKGTNTTDKKLGSVGLIRKALQYPVRCFIATHDLSLGTLEEEYPGQVVSYCFESYIQDMELSFDYRIRPGIARNMNASFLMKQMGIMD